MIHDSCAQGGVRNGIICEKKGEKSMYLYVKGSVGMNHRWAVGQETGDGGGKE